MKGKVETVVGIFVFLGILCIAYLTLKFGQLQVVGGDYYDLKAKFESVTGLRKGSDVRISGVRVGRVKSIYLDPNDYSAVVVFSVKKGIKLSDDSVVMIKTSGLIGDKYLSILPGGSDNYLKPGDMVVETQSSISIEDLISKYVFGGVGSNKK